MTTYSRRLVAGPASTHDGAAHLIFTAGAGELWVIKAVQYTVGGAGTAQLLVSVDAGVTKQSVVDGVAPASGILDVQLLMFLVLEPGDQLYESIPAAVVRWTRHVDGYKLPFP